jgi:hypothetical protein
MPIMLNSLLRNAGIPIEEVCLVRHQDGRADPGRSPFDLWRNDPPAFEAYQSVQGISQRGRFKGARYWAVFVGTPAGETVFVNLYRASYKGVLRKDMKQPHRSGIDKAGTRDSYDLRIDPRLGEFSGRLLVDWGEGAHAWVQRASRQNKVITELHRAIKEPEFPGYLNLELRLSQLAGLSPGWIGALKAAKGIYLITCPKTGEVYVGQAGGKGGFWQRWLDYRNGHGGNVAFKSRAPKDYLISILEVARSPCEPDELTAREQLWIRKLDAKTFN